MIAAFAALLALVLQSLYAVPASNRMMLDEALSASDDGSILCLAAPLAQNNGQHLPALPSHHKAHCSLCVIAGLAALVALSWLLAALIAPPRRAQFRFRTAFVRPHPQSEHRSRAPPSLI